MGEKRAEDRPKTPIPPPPPRQPDERLKGYIERGNKSEPPPPREHDRT